MRFSFGRAAASLSLLLCLAAHPPARAERYAFDRARCMVVVPDSGWSLDRATVTATRNILLAARQNDGRRTLLLMAMPLKEKYDLETEGLAGSVTRAIAGHASIVRIDTLDLRGMPAHLILAREHRGGESYTLATAANGFLYVYSSYARDASSIPDPATGAVRLDLVSLDLMRRFDFVGLPEVDYVASRPGGAYAWGYRAAGIILFLLLAGIAGFLLNRRARGRASSAATRAPGDVGDDAAGKEPGG